VNLIYKVNCHLVGMSVIQAYLQLRFCRIAVLLPSNHLEVHPGTEGRTIKERRFWRTISCQSAAVS